MRSNDNTRKQAILALSGLKGVGPAFFKKVSIDQFGENAMESMQTLLGTNLRYRFEDLNVALDNARDVLDACKEENVTVIDCFSSEYPESLKRLKDAPSILFCKGNLELLYERKVCIIGTREPNENGKKIANRIGMYFSAANMTICNGLAEGVDRFAVCDRDVVHSKVLGVLAGGLNYNTSKTITKKNVLFAEKVLEAGGLLISECLLGKKEDTFSIVKSCRLQAGLSNGLILVQSSLSGGSKYTVKAFCELNQPFGVVQPVSTDYVDLSFEANVAIIENQIHGLSKFADLSIEKIQIRNLKVIKSKEDYDHFFNLMLEDSSEPKNNGGTLSLFD